MTRHTKRRLVCHAIARLMEIVGTLLIFMDHVRISAIINLVGLASYDGEPAKYHPWFYHSGNAGFVLLFAGMGIGGAALWLEHRAFLEISKSQNTL